MTVTRYQFGTTLCEVHTTQERDRARATSYVVQEYSVALQPCAAVGPCDGPNEDEARAMAVRRLEEHFGPQTSRPGLLQGATGYRLLDPGTG